MRYRSSTSRLQTRPAGKDRWRLWMLLLTLGLVLVAMRQLDRPETVERLGQVFGSNQQTSVEQPSEQLHAEIEPTTIDLTQSLVVGSTEKSSETGELDGIDLSTVRDKTYFRPEERPAWFALLGQLQGMNQEQVTEASVGELTYAQLLQQPEVYRGRLVTIRGTVLREELQPLVDNPLGLTEYHRLWIQPQGGGQWPFVVYCLRLPNNFPRGDAIRATVQVHGYFFKNWSYSWEEGLGLAPVILADQPLWQPPVRRPSRQKSSGIGWTPAIAIACIFACGVTWLALNRTRRRAIQPNQEEAARREFIQFGEEVDT